jgi:hypothetical protein
MAGVRFVSSIAETATGTSALTLLQIVAAAQQRVKISEISISFKGTSNTAAPILVQIMIQTAGSEAKSAGTVSKWNPADDETLQTTACITFTTEPTYGVELLKEEVHPQTGYTWQAPFGGEIIVPGGKLLGIVVTAGVSVSAVCRVIGEE